MIQFEHDVFHIMPNKQSVKFNMIGAKLPTNKDIFFRSKQEETLERYQAARRFMYELDTDDWNHYFQPIEDAKGNLYFQNVLRAQLYEAALMFYNSVIDLSWITCYVSAEYLVYLDGNSFDIEQISSIDEAYAALRKAEGIVQNPNADDSFSYLKKICPNFSMAIDYIIEFWSSFSQTTIRNNYNYLKHKGALHYREIEELKPDRILKFHVDGIDCPSDIRDVQKEINLCESIEELKDFDNNALFPYIETLFSELEKQVNPSPFIF